MNKYPIQLQDEENACGAFCILMILKYYGFQEEITQIKKHARLNKNGMTIKSIIECFKYYQIESYGYEIKCELLKEKCELPCILFMIYDGLGHFVVLYEIKDEEYIIGDPAKGLVTISYSELEQHYGKCVVMIRHVGRVPQLTYNPYKRFLKENFISYQQELKSFLKKGLWISLLGYVSSYFFQIIIDYITLKTHLFYMITLSICYCLTEIIKVRFEYMKTKTTIQLQKAMNEDCVFQSSMMMLQQPFLFFEQDEGYIQSQLLSFYDLSQMNILFFERIFVDGISVVVFLIGMSVINHWMFVIVCIMFLVIGVYLYYCLEKIKSVYKKFLERQFSYQHHLLELIQNQFLIQTFSLLQKTKERSYHKFMDVEDYKERHCELINKMQTRLQYVMYLFYGIILCVGFYNYLNKTLTLGQLMMFYTLVSFCLNPVMNIVLTMNQYKQMEMIYEKYKTFRFLERDCKQEFNDKIENITFDDLGYSYGYQKPVLEHIDLCIQKHLWLKGKTGCGKSTLLKILMGYDLNYTGNIYINQRELRTIDLQSLYKHIGYMNETPTFLHMTLEDNFLCNDENLIYGYLKSFQQLELLDMFHIVLSEDGSPLSLGQRQVVALIRLLVQNYDVLILDEAFSHMDSNLSKRIIRYLLKHDEDKKYIIVNHQTKIVNKSFDYVIIEEGKLKSEG